MVRVSSKASDKAMKNLGELCNQENIVIDNKDILSYFYDSREVFVVDFNSNLVKVELEKGTATFSLKRGK